MYVQTLPLSGQSKGHPFTTTTDNAWQKRG